MALEKKDLRDLRKQNAHLNDIDFELSIACFHNDTASVGQLLKNGANASCRFHNGYIHESTPLILVAQHGNEEAMRLVLAAGADPKARTTSEVGGAGNRSALLEVISCGKDSATRERLATLLIAHGADPDAADNAGRTPLQAAAHENDWAVIQLLVNAGASVSQSEAKMAFFSASSPALMDWFLSKGWSIETEGANRRTRLLIATENGNEEEIEYCISRGANIRHTDSDGVGVLSYLARYANRARLPKEHERALRIVKRLLELSAIINCKDRHGKTPLDYAKLGQNPGFANFLKANGAKLGRHVK